MFTEGDIRCSNSLDAFCIQCRYICKAVNVALCCKELLAESSFSTSRSSRDIGSAYSLPIMGGILRVLNLSYESVDVICTSDDFVRWLRRENTKWPS